MLVWFLHSWAGCNKATVHVKTETRFKEVSQRSLGNLFKHFLEFYLDTTGFFPKNSFNHSVSRSRNLPKTGLVFHLYFCAVQTILVHPRIFFGLTETSSHGNIRLFLACPRISFGLAESSLHNNYFCNNACTRLRCHFLWANPDIFAWQHMTCLGPPKELITLRTSSSILSSEPSCFRKST
jgi:hypothetical protein